MNVPRTIDIEPNQVAICKDTVDLGAYRFDWFYNLADEDLTGTWVQPRLVSDELRAYLDQYFTGWRLLRRVTMLRHHPGANPYKILLYVLQVGTDADAETLRSRLVHTDYKTPLQSGLR